MNLEEVQKFWDSTDKIIVGKNCRCDEIVQIEITINVNYCNLVGVNFNTNMPTTSPILDGYEMNGVP